MIDADKVNLAVLAEVRFTKPLVLEDVIALYDMVHGMKWSAPPKIDCYQVREGVVFLCFYEGSIAVWSREYEVS